MQKVNGNLVLTRKKDDIVHITIPFEKLEKLVKQGKDVEMDIRTYGFSNKEGVDEVKLAFMDRRKIFNIQRSERFANERDRS